MVNKNHNTMWNSSNATIGTRDKAMGISKRTVSCQIINFSTLIWDLQSSAVALIKLVRVVSMYSLMIIFIILVLLKYFLF